MLESETARAGGGSGRTRTKWRHVYWIGPLVVLATAWAATAGVGVREVMAANGLTQEQLAVPLTDTAGSVGVRAESEGWAPCPLIVVVEWSCVPYGAPGGPAILGGGGYREVHVWVFGYQQRLWKTALWIS